MTSLGLEPAAPVKPSASRDAWIMRLYLGIIILYLLVSLALPLGVMIAKSFYNHGGEFVGLANFRDYFSTPALRASIAHSLVVATVTTLITTVLAFLYAYALQRSCIPGKSVFRALALVPILVPSLLPGIALVYLFGRQGLLHFLFFGASIYGPLGIVLAEVFFTFPHALLIMLSAFALTDARLYEAATVLRASPIKMFCTITVPGVRYGLISAAFVVFTLAITDFGAPKVIGGQYNVLAVDIYRQVIGQQNFEMGAVVSMVLLLPAIIAFLADRLMQRKQVALLSARAVPFVPRPNPRLDRSLLVFCGVIGLFLVGMVLTCQFAAVAKFYPYDLSLSLRHYRFDLMDGGGYEAYGNSLRLAMYTAAIGTFIILTGAYVVEKGRGFSSGRASCQFLAMMPMAVPGMVLGLAYIFFFNHPSNPLRFAYGTMAILVVCTITHFYTVAHLAALTALKQLSAEFEDVSLSLKQPVYKLVLQVTGPVCLPTILDIAIYLFVNAMTTVSAVVFIYSPETTLAAIAVLNMDDAGNIASAAAMGMMIFYANAAVRLLHAAVTHLLQRRFQAWRQR